MVDQQKNIFSARESFFKQHRLLVITSTVVIVLSVILIAAPIVIKHQLTKQIRQLGASEVTIDNVDFNLFTGELVIDNTQYVFTDQNPFNCRQALVNIDVIPLFSNHFFVNNFRLDNCSISIKHPDDETWVINGLAIPVATDDSASANATPADSEMAWLAGIHRLALSDVTIVYQDKKLNSNIELKDVSINDFFPWEPDVLSTFSINMAVNDAPLAFEGSAKPFHDNRSLTATLSVSELALEKFSPLFNSKAFTLSRGKLTTELELQSGLNADNQYEVNITGFIDNHSLSAAMTDSTLTYDKLLWNGKVDLAIDRLDLSTSLFTDYTLALDNINFDAGSQPWTMNVATVTAQGQVSAKRKDKSIGPPHLIGNMEVSKLALANTGNGLEIARIGSIDVNDFEWLSENHIRVPALRVRNARIIGKPDNETKQRVKKPYLVEFAELDVDTSEFRDMNKLTTASVVISDLQSQLVKSRDGSLQYIDQVKQTFEPVATGEQPLPDTKPAPVEMTSGAKDNTFSFQVGIFETKGTNNLTFKDLSVQPEFQLNVRNMSAKVVSIDNTAPANKTRINISGDLDDSGSFSLEGESQLFSPQLTTALDAKIQNLELYPLSGYTRPVSGRKIHHGFLNAISSINIKNRNLDNKNKIVIKNLTLVKDDDKVAQQYDKQMPLPPEMAIDFLKDKNGRIELSVPVKGNLDNPDFRFVPAVIKTIRETMQRAALLYMKYTLQPWGSLILVGELVAGQASKVAFEPLIFPAGSSDIQSNQKTYLDKIARLMQDTPHIGLTVCGIATEQDKNALTTVETQQQASVPDQQELINLAQQRADAVRDYFNTQRNIDRKRLHDCNATYREDPSAKPSVEFIF